MRIGLGQIYQETNTFSPRPTTMADFECRFVHRGHAMIEELRRTRTEVGGILEVLEANHCELVPTVAAWAMPGGRVEQACFESLASAISEPFRDAALDGVVLSLHGAMCAEAVDDADGAVLARVRDIIGPDCPLTCALDWHSNLTDQMLANADQVLGYRTFPHEDLFETGARAAEALLTMIRSGRRPPPPHVRRLPLIPQAVTSGSNNEPMRSLLGKTAALESEHPGSSISLFLTQPWLDLPDFASTAVMYEASPRAAARFDQIVTELWERRFELDGHWPDASGAIDAALQPGPRPAIVIDLGNVVLAGAPGTSTELVRALLEHPDKPRCVATLCAPGPLAGLTGHLPGGRHRLVFEDDGAPPLELEGTLIRLVDVSYRLRGPYLAGVEFRPGPRALIDCGHLQLVLSQAPESAQDPAYYTSMGLDLNGLDLVTVKSHNTFKPSYADLSQRYVYADTMGQAAASPQRLPYRRLPRPIYPLDSDAVYEP